MIALLVALLAVSVPVVIAQCNPILTASCPPIPGLPTSTYSVDFTQQTKLPDGWILADQANVTFGSDGAKFWFNKRGQAPYIWTNFYIAYGRVDVELMVSNGTGIITSSVLFSDDQDEIDWEFSGSNFAASSGKAYTNYFGKGLTGNYDRASLQDVSTPQKTFHTYSFDWSTTNLRWLIDGVDKHDQANSGATTGNYQFPQTPARLHLGMWDAGDPNTAGGTVNWAGGYTNYSNTPYYAIVRSVKISTPYPCSSWQYPTNFSGKWTDVTCTNQTVSSTVTSSTQTSTSSASTTTANTKCTATSYTVAGGDYGWGIADQFGLTFDALSAVNTGVNWDQLNLGQVLNIPCNITSTSISSSASPTSSSSASTSNSTSNSGVSTMSTSTISTSNSSSSSSILSSLLSSSSASSSSASSSSASSSSASSSSASSSSASSSSASSSLASSSSASSSLASSSSASSSSASSSSMPTSSSFSTLVATNSSMTITLLATTSSSSTMLNSTISSNSVATSSSSSTMASSLSSSSSMNASAVFSNLKGTFSSLIALSPLLHTPQNSSATSTATSSSLIALSPLLNTPQTSSATSTATVSSISGTSTSLPQGWSYGGCFTDNLSPRSLNTSSGISASQMNNTMCTAYCDSKGFIIAGTEWSGECYCGMTITNTKQANQTDCNMKCYGAPGEMCGGSALLSVYYKNTNTSTNAITSSALSSSSSTIGTVVSSPKLIALPNTVTSSTSSLSSTSGTSSTVATTTSALFNVNSLKKLTTSAATSDQCYGYMTGMSTAASSFCSTFMNPARTITSDIYANLFAQQCSSIAPSLSSACNRLTSATVVSSTSSMSTAIRRRNDRRERNKGVYVTRASGAVGYGKDGQNEDMESGYAGKKIGYSG